MRLSSIGQMAFLLARSRLVHSLGPSGCTPNAGATPVPIKQFIVGMAPVLEARVDPIVAPDQASAHIHFAMGNSNFGPFLDGDSALNASCTSAQAKVDNSAYWTPRVSFRSPKNGSYFPVPAVQEKVYYTYDHYITNPSLSLTLQLLYDDFRHD